MDDSISLVLVRPKNRKWREILNFEISNIQIFLQNFFHYFYGPVHKSIITGAVHPARCRSPQKSKFSRKFEFPTFSLLDHILYYYYFFNSPVHKSIIAKGLRDRIILVSRSLSILPVHGPRSYRQLIHAPYIVVHCYSLSRRLSKRISPKQNLKKNKSKKKFLTYIYFSTLRRCCYEYYFLFSLSKLILLLPRRLERERAGPFSPRRHIHLVLTRACVVTRRKTIFFFFFTKISVVESKIIKMVTVSIT